MDDPVVHAILLALRAPYRTTDLRTYAKRLHQRFGLHAQHLIRPRRERFEKLQRLANALFRVMTFLRQFRAGQAIPQHGQRRIDLALPASLHDQLEQFPDIRGRFKVVATVPHHMHHLREAPGLEFFQTRTHIGAGDTERVRDLVRCDWAAEQIQQRMNLRDGAVDAPARAHFAPVENESFGNWCEFHVSDFIYFSYFCQERNNA